MNVKGGDREKNKTIQADKRQKAFLFEYCIRGSAMTHHITIQQQIVFQGAIGKLAVSSQDIFEKIKNT